MSIKKNTFESGKDDLANVELIKEFNNVYNDVLQGNGHAMKINSFFDNQAGNLLLDACKHMIYAPILGSIANPVAHARTLLANILSCCICIKVEDFPCATMCTSF